MKHTILLLAFSLFLITGFTQTMISNSLPFANIPKEYQGDVNNLLNEMFEGVGLYTILGDFKPISTVKLNSLSVYTFVADVMGKNGEMVKKEMVAVPQSKEEARQYNDKVSTKVKYYSTVLELMSNNLFYFQFMPQHSHFEKMSSNPTDSFEVTRVPEILILRKDLTLNTIKEKAEFFKSINVDTLDYINQLKTILFDEIHSSKSALTRHENNRAYGYLYGYPDYAVDYFVGRQLGKETKPQPLVKPKVIHIPVYGKGSGYTYIIPEEDNKRNKDEILIEKAEIVLKNYKTRREHYLKDNQFDAIQFVQYWFDYSYSDIYLK